MGCCAAAVPLDAPGDNFSLSSCSLRSWRKRISRARSMTFARQSRQTGDFDSVAAICAARFHALQKNNSGGRFADGDMNIFHARQQVRQFCQFVIMRSEKSSRVRFGLQMFDDGPGDAQSIKRRGAAAHFVEQN